MKPTPLFPPFPFGHALAASCLALALTFPTIAARAQNVSNAFWQSQSIYQVITDRYFNGDTSNDNAEGNYGPGNSGSVHGGDFKGLEQKLDYIKSLGATAIWISPVVLNANGEFHGYAGRDFFSVAPHWGSLADLQHLIQTAHSKGLLVIDDIICNHGGDLVYSTDPGYANFLAPPAGYNLVYRSSKQYAAPFNTNAANPSLTNLFHNNGAIPDYNTPQHYQLGELSGLDDFRTESPYIRSNMVAVYEYWIGQAGFDGFRIDTVKHIETGFWQNWCPLVHTYAATNGKPNFFMFGEVYDGSDSLCGSYTGTEAGGPFALDSVLDYPLYFMVNSVFATASGSTSQIESRYAALPANYDPTARDRLVTFLDNHDQPRFLSNSGATTNRLKVALAFLYTSRGIPCLYYGTEQAFNGTTDPNDREDMFAGQFEPSSGSVGDNFNMTHPLFQWVATLNNFRRLYPALQTGYHSNLWSNASGPGLFAYSRQLGTQEVFVVFNTAGSSQTLPDRPTLYPAGTTLVNLLDTTETGVVAAGSRTPSITVPATSAKIFIAQSQMLPLDPVVTSMTPAHDATNIVRVAPIVLHFSKPMDTNSVMAAFSTSPAVSGSFAWSASADTLTFSPTATGFPAQTLFTVQLAATAADAVSSNLFYAGFSARFKTGTNAILDVTPPSVLIQSPTNGAIVGGLLPISGTATDNVAVQKVEVCVDTNAWSQATGTSAWTYSLNTSNFLNGSHVLSARATDTVGNLSPTNSISVQFSNIVDVTPPSVLIQSPANGAFVGGLLPISGTANDNGSVQKVEVCLDTNAWSLATGTSAWSYNLNTSNFLNGSHMLSARATDSSGNLSPTNSVSVQFLNVPGAYVQRIAGGNPSNITDCAASLWVRDQAYSLGSFGYSGGTTGNLANTITGICASAQGLYQRERYSTSSAGFQFLFDCPIGIYETTLLEAETYWTGAGQRVFNAFIEGQQVLTNFDIYSAAGGKNLPLSRVFTNTVADGQLQILFTPVVDNARVSGIQVRKLADLYSDKDGIPDWWRLAYFGHATGQSGDKSRASDDADGDGASNLQEFLAGTNPLDSNSVFKITGFTPAGTNLQVVWPTRANKLYQLQERDSLDAATAWTNLGTSIPGVDSVVTQVVTGATGNVQLFRVRAQ